MQRFPHLNTGRTWLVILTVFTMISTAFASSGSQPGFSHHSTHSKMMERSAEKIARYEAHSKFLQRCLRHNLLPKGLQPNFGYAALPKVGPLHNAIAVCLDKASRHITVSIMDAYRDLAKRERLLQHQYLYDLFQSGDNQQYLSIRNHLQHLTDNYCTEFQRTKLQSSKSC